MTRFMRPHVIVMALAVALGLLVLSACAGAPLPATPIPAIVTAEPTATPTSQPSTAVAGESDELTLLPATAELDGIPVGFTEDGHAYRGSPDADVVVVEYSDFQCPYCGRYERETAPQIREAYLKTGKVVLVFRDFPLEEIHPNARKAAESARCAGEQGADQFWRMHDLLFARAADWSQLPDPVDTFKGYAKELELDQDAFAACLDSGRTSEAIDADLSAGLAQGVRGTPTFFLNGNMLVGAQPYEAFAQAFDALLAGEPMPTPESAEGQIPYWATAEGMSPDPDRPGYTLAGDPFKGDPAAPVVLIEFSDFQCPYCAVYVKDTEPQIEKNYIEPGKVRVIFKHFPVPGHGNAPFAAVVAECAGQQGQFWQMHDRLFATQGEWGGLADPRERFTQMAEELRLDLEAFNACIDDPDTEEKVNGDFTEGRRVGIQGTPNFVLLVGRQGYLIPGALPYEQFQQIFDEVLASVQ